MISPGYLIDRKSLGFSCLKDMESIPDFLIITNNKQKIIFIRLNEVVFAVGIFLNSSSIKPDGNYSSSQDYKYLIIPSNSSKSDYLQCLRSSSSFDE